MLEISRKGAKTQRRRLSKSFAFMALCLLPAAYCLLSSILSAQNANQSPTPQTATAQTSPSPSPTPTPPLTLHQWGAVTLFHGLPSDRVRAVAQSEDGAMWFGTDSGLAKYDGRRTQTITVEGLMSKRVLALKLDADGSLWVGAETGATRIVNNDARAIPETAGRSIKSIITPERGHAILASEDGMIFDCQVNPDGSLTVKSIPEKPLRSEDFERPGPLNLTSLALKDNVLYVGTLTRGVIAIEDDKVSEIKSTPRPFFVNTVAADSEGHLWYGAKAKKDESGLYKANDVMRPTKVGASTGPVAVIIEGLHDDMWVGTDGHGVFHYDNAAHLIERFTFDGTAGGLRSDHVYSIFIDREEVIWFGTDRGVCRYDPHAPRVENVSTHPESNFVRTLFQTSNGTLLAGTNRGLFLYEKSEWTPVQELSQSPIYAITEEKSGRLIVGAAIGLYRSEKPTRENASALHFKQIESASADSSAGDQIRAIAELQGKTYIAVLGRGIERVDEGGRTLVWPNSQMDAQAREVISLHADRSGRLLIGTSSAGVFIFDGKSTTTLPALEKLKGAAVRAIFDEGNDRLWLASARGLYLYHAGELKEIATGLDVRDLAATTDSSSASVWCATSTGILKVLMDDQLGAIISRLDVEQGLPSQNTFAVLPVPASDNNETLLIGTNRGVARYTPSRVAPVLTPVRIIGQRIHQLDELRTGVNLDYPQNSL
ncbi:MAG TPA: two-component regulator propeller domain-containing protein, partial [Pyrinomonadaceae bacterium]|nr:two-component regulator propeller domain-containing protein [Pyrinomonadaceae bacterium]